MNVRQLKAALSVIPESMQEVEFVAFSTTNGVRVCFPENSVNLNYMISHGRPMVELQGSQDENQLS